MKQTLILFVSIFLGSLYSATAREACSPTVDFSEDEYKVISKIISALDFDIYNDTNRIRELPLQKRFIWNAFVWRFYNGNKRNNDLYFTKLSGIAFEEITLSAHKQQLRFFQNFHASDLVLNEFLSMFPPPKFSYSDKDLLWVEKVFLRTNYAPLRDTAFYILLVTQRLSSKSDKKILKTLSKKELDRLASFEEKKRNKAR